MMIMKKYIPLLLLISLFVSCEKVIEFDTTVSESQLILNAMPSNGDQLFVNFAYSRFFLDDNNDHPVPNVDMTILVNGVPYSPDSMRSCNYYFGYNLQDDDVLDINIRAGGNTISAHTYVPRMPRISTPDVSVLSTYVDLLSVQFNIDDYADYKEYYCFTVQQRDSGFRYNPFLEKIDTIDTTYTTYFLCQDKQLANTEAINIEGMDVMAFNRLLATDEHIDGTNHPTALYVWMYKDTNEIYPFIHQYTLNVESVTPDRYRYLQDLGMATSIIQLITEPAPVHSNVEGALGIFAGNAKRVFPLATITNDSTLAYKPRNRKK